MMTEDEGFYFGGNYMLLQYQKRNLEKLKDAAKENNELTVIGATNSGRKYVIKEWGNTLKKSIIIEIKTSKNKDAYASLISAIKEENYFRKDVLKFSPSFSIPGILGSINISLEKGNFSKTEGELINLLSKAIRRHTLVFIIDKEHLPDDDSIKLIGRFREKYKENNKIYIIYVSNTFEKQMKNIYFENISDCSIPPKEILKELNFIPSAILGDKVINFIFKNINNNVNLLIRIVDDLNAGNLDTLLENYDKNNIINELLEYSEEKYKYKKQLLELLSICAISEHYFQSIDFAYLLEEHEGIIKSILEYAREKLLIDTFEDSFYILFGIVSKIYASLDEIEKKRIYIKIFDMFSFVYPSKYYQKYIYAKRAQMNEYRKYLVQYIFAEIRLNHNLDINKYKNELNKNEFNLIKVYNKASGYNKYKEYDKCIEELETLTDLNLEFIYEINIVKSQALIKKMDESSRKKAVGLLDYESSLADENLKFRLNIRKIAALVHIGKYSDALKLCQSTTGYLINMIESTHSMEYEYYLNVIYRKYSYVSAYDTSINEVKKSVDFFRIHQNEYHTGYYIALTNLLSLYIINMQVEKAKEVKKEIEELLTTKNSISFPRKEILENNLLLYNFFIDSVDLEIICEGFRRLHAESKGYADYILISSNYSIFLMLNNKFELAENILLETIPNTERDLEGIYDTRIKINLAICKFLMNNKDRDKCIKILDSVQYNDEAPYYRNRLDELNNIKHLMSTIESCDNAQKWCETFKNNILTPLAVYTTYQQGFVYTTLFNWDDD